MSRPMQMYLYVHDAILREVAGIEEEARELNRDDDDAVADLTERLGWFHTMLHTHERAEESVLFPAMEERHSFIAEAYFYDHDDFENHLWGDINGALAGFTSGDRTRKEAATDLHRESVALHEHMRLHIAKENELLIPRLEKEFDVAEQAELAGALAAVFDPQLMGQTVVWMYRSQTNEDREGMIRFLANVLPDEAFVGLSGTLAGLDADAWAEMTKRIPELA